MTTSIHTPFHIHFLKTKIKVHRHHFWTCLDADREGTGNTLIFEWPFSFILFTLTKRVRYQCCVTTLSLLVPREDSRYLNLPYTILKIRAFKRLRCILSQCGSSLNTCLCNKTQQPTENQQLLEVCACA